MKIDRYIGIYCRGKTAKELELAIKLVPLKHIPKVILDYVIHSHKAKKKIQVLLQTDDWRGELSFVDFIRYFLIGKKVI